MHSAASERRTPGTSVASLGRVTVLAGVLTVLATVSAIWGNAAFGQSSFLLAAGFLGAVFCGTLFAYRLKKAHLERYRLAEQMIACTLSSKSSDEINVNQGQLHEMALLDPPIRDLVAANAAAISHHLGRVFEAEAMNLRRQNVIARCADAKRNLADQLEQRRLASPAIRAERTIAAALDKLRHHKAEAAARLNEERKRRKLKWWFDLTAPDFAEVDAKIEELEGAQKRLVQSGDIRRTDNYYLALGSLVNRRTAQIEREALSAIPAKRNEPFDDVATVQNALILSALSVPVSAWGDFALAGDVYDSLRAVNGNYADMSDADIWLDTLTMSGPQLAGLANLTKGALFEKFVEVDTGGQLFKHFNHPDTDIVVDDIAYQIKATDSVGYVNGVADDIPVISTSEVAEMTGSIDGGYANEDLTQSVDLALGGTVLDISDTAFDAVLTGVGGFGIFAILRGLQSGAAAYRKDGESFEAVVDGASVTVVSTARSAVNMAEIVVKGSVGVATSRPMRFVGRTMASGVNRFDRWLESPEEVDGVSRNSHGGPKSKKP